MDEIADLPRVGLIGLGNAGRAMLQALAPRFPMIVHDRDPERRARASDSPHPPEVAPDVAACARRADVLILSLPTPEVSLAVARDIAGAIPAGTTLIETSTVRPEDVEALHAVLAPAGVRVVDAALVGGVQKLAQGRAVFLAGVAPGETGVLAPVLGAMAEEIFWLGARGAGMRMKLTVNAVAHAVYVVLAEAGALAAAQDLPLDVFRRLLGRESGLARPLAHRFGERLRHGDFAGGMSTSNVRKDSRLAIDAANDLGVPLFAIPAAHAVYEIAAREGLATQDYAAVAQLWERWLDISFADPPGTGGG